MKIGNAEFNLEQISKYTREEFIATFKGKGKFDINQAADLLDKHFKKEEVKEVVEESVEEKPKRRRKRK